MRFICGTFTVHRELEAALARFVGTEASMSYVSAWNANEGLTATIVEEGDFVISDALNHASIIDSMRLAKSITKCTTGVYKHTDMDDLVREARGPEGGTPARDLDRRRLLHGREHREAARDSCRSRATTTHRADGRLARDRRARQDRRGTAEHMVCSARWT